MLSISALQTHYGLSNVIQGVDLKASQGEVLGIFGRNGVGKTTLLKSIAGWVKPTSGHIRLEGEEIGNLDPDQICRRGVGFVPEDRRIFPGLTTEENLQLGLLQVRRGGSEERKIIDGIFTRFPRLLERRKQLATTLSGGEQQMLAMARVMAGDAKLVLIDEPSEGLAPMIVAEVFKIIADFRTKGATVLLVEQNIVEAMKVVDRFIVLERGSIVLDGKGNNAKDFERLSKALAV